VSTGKLLNGGLLYDLGDKSGNVEGPQVMNVKHYCRPGTRISTRSMLKLAKAAAFCFSNEKQGQVVEEKQRRAAEYWPRF